MIRILASVAAGWMAMLPVLEGQIVWSCDPNSTNQSSSGAAMDAAFVFELGVFDAGFTPTPSNLVDWLEHWNPVQQSAYVPATGRYNAFYQVLSNAPPFLIGAEAWVFGRKPGAAVDEWILFRSSEWLWPEVGGMGPFQLEWNASQADEVVLGTVDPSGSPFLMRSAEVRSFAQWQSVELAGELLDGPDDDPDRDGLRNAIEFVLGTSPLTADAVVTTALDFVAGHARISVPRLAGRLVHLSVEVSEDMATWASGPAHLEVVAETTTSLVVRDLVATGPLRPRAFYRLRAELP